MTILGKKPTNCKLCGGKLHRRDLRCIECGSPNENPRQQIKMGLTILGAFLLFCILFLFFLKYLVSKS